MQLFLRQVQGQVNLYIDFNTWLISVIELALII